MPETTKPKGDAPITGPPDHNVPAEKPDQNPPPVMPVKPKVEWYRVVLTHPSLNGRTVFRSVSATRAQEWVERHYPRGSEAHLVGSDGTTTHYENERAGERGADVELWAPFNPEDWVPAEQQVPPGQDEWSDKEG